MALSTLCRREYAQTREPVSCSYAQLNMPIYKAGHHFVQSSQLRGRRALFGNDTYHQVT